MSTKRVLSLLQKGWTTLVDPDREERLNRAVALVHRALSDQRDAFDLEATLAQHEINEGERDEIVQRIYQKCLNKAWSDSTVTAKELRTLEWVATRLQMQPQEAARLLREQAESVFAATLAESFHDGVLNDTKYSRLSEIASACNSTPADFFQSQFREQGESFLRGLFLRVLYDGDIDHSDWTLITQTVSRLGLSKAEFLATVKAPAEQFAEHLLADFKSDDEISPEEEKHLNWVLANCLAEGDFADYIRSEISMVKKKSRIRRGHLPIVSAPPGFALKSGEIVHFAGTSRFISAKRRRDGTAAKVVFGMGVVTDNRFVFTSAEHSLQVSHNKILGFQRQHNGLEIQCSGAAAGYYALPSFLNSATEIWLAAIQKANQTLVTPRQNRDTRHIPREVRQRIWQRYGGRCAECNSMHYLEFDHIIPVARGGGNSDNNVQLLCRDCNNRKSDNI